MDVAPTVTFSNYAGPVVYKWWKEGDPIPTFSKEVGIIKYGTFNR